MSDIDAWAQHARSIPIEDELARRGIHLRGKIERCGPCPKCGGDDRFSINTAKGIFNCRGCGVGGDTIDLVMHLDGVDFAGACTTLAGAKPANGKANRHAPEPRKVTAAAQPYTDESGDTLLVVARIEYRHPDGSYVLKDGKRKKTFAQKRPDPNKLGAWIYDADGVRIVPYRLPELIEAIGNGHAVLIVEGEAKVDLLRSWNVPATCCAGGAKKWKPEHSAFLHGADAILLPDNDAPGREHADLIGASLRGIASRIRILELPDLPAKGDICDWAAAGGTREWLDGLIETAPDWQPHEASSDKADESNDAPAAGISDLPLLSEVWLKRDLPPPDYLIGDWLTTTSRALFTADTGLGKTNFALAAFAHLAAGVNFLHWRITKPRRVLYIDGEMSRRLLKQRLEDATRPAGLHVLSQEDVEDFQPLNSEGGQQFIRDVIKHVGAEAVAFDNIMALIIGDMKDEDAWRDTLPLVIN